MTEIKVLPKMLNVVLEVVEKLTKGVHNIQSNLISFLFHLKLSKLYLTAMILR